MGRKKNPENKTRIENIREKLDQSRQLPSKPYQVSSDEISARDKFSEFWAQNRKKFDRPRELEDVIWAHLKASGHDKPELFTKGLTHFGLVGNKE